VNIGAAGTFVSRRPVDAPAIARELPFERGVDVVVRPSNEVLRLVEAGPPRIPADTVLFVSIAMKASTKKPALPFDRPSGRDWAVRVVERRGAFVISARHRERQRALDLSAVLAREFGVPFTTRSWGTMERIAAAIREL
jgi:hypothetical protein